jgi:bifunctional N-acetylglucosamine-1-phosphate-uridyltransferase/glucosamine-1-phosphate-acetyltransferase GlmU-like protein
LPRLGSSNNQNEIYLTDIIGLGYQEKRSWELFIGHDGNEIIGVNSQAELQRCRAVDGATASGKILTFCGQRL